MAHILVIDDDEEMLAWLEMVLIDKGHSVVTTNDAKIALMKIKHRQERFQVILTDIIMHEFDGIDIIAKLAIDGNKTPIIAMSGSTRKLTNSDLNLSAARAMGVKETLKKPFTANELQEAIERLITFRP